MICPAWECDMRNTLGYCKVTGCVKPWLLSKYKQYPSTSYTIYAEGNMIIKDKKPVPMYESTCPECKSTICYKKSEVSFTGYITCPVCGMSMWANTINPVRYCDCLEQDQPPQVKTYWMDFCEKFPNRSKEHDESDHMNNTCVKWLYGEKASTCSPYTCEQCWNQPMKE